MHLPAPDDPHDPVAQRAADKRRLASALKRSLGFVLLLVIVLYRPKGLLPEEKVVSLDRDLA